jgi:hypothetical protein
MQLQIRLGGGVTSYEERQERQPRTLTKEGSISRTVEPKHGPQVDPYSCLRQPACLAQVGFCTYLDEMC